MDEALALVAAAEAAAAQAAAVDVVPAGGRPGQELSGGRSFVWRHGLVRPAANVKQSADFAKAGQTMAAQPTLAAQGTNAGSFASGSGGRSSTRIRILTAAELETLVPGLNLPAHVANVSAPTPTASPGSTSVEAAPVPAPAPAAATDAAGGNRRARRAAAAAAAATVDPASNAGLLIEAGLVLDVGLYLRGLWLACQAEAEARSDGSTAQLRLQRVASLEHLRPSHAAPALSANDNRSDSSCSGGVRGYDVVVVAAGAAAATIDEVAALGLPLQLCQGLTLVMAPPGGGVRDAAGSGTTGPGADDSGCGAGYPATAPSLLGQPYLAAQSRHRLVVGATKAYGWSAEQALAACGRSEYAEARGGGDVPVAGGLEAQQAVEALRAAACGVWRPLSDWQVDRVREGVRALPPRTQHGSLPLLGRVAPGRPWWLVAGLGSRGLVYHGWLGRLVAEAALGEVLAGSATVGGVGSSTAGGAAGDGESVGQGLQDSGRRRGEAGFPEELTAWRRVAPGAAVFEAP
ncbi:hypothetical protein HYH02_005973 [Chlamydomonas schloesseri]|uniref:FAD dependent oxidoreductase domain-containing protein n=1 Tax=Chlamydomonas schloesseri TaxID=2026947 RepID=A0A836B6P4_9CHLO|nr:hypothetical protein HYH02_005973 [Chlamydomonas schloesseri]|eukprot:KAG2449227.1 hypothetical protein HYH02_005973 [Chlamydomonas schloesseri]